MKYVIIIISCLVLFSCNNLKKEEKLISNNNTKYWNIVYPPIQNRGLLKGYCFNKDGTYQRFNYYKNKRYSVETNDIEYDRTWKCLNDSFLIMSKEKVRILRLTKDTFSIQFKDKSIIKFVRSENQRDTVSKHFPYKDFISGDTIHISR